MNSVRKTMLLLGVVMLLLCVPLTAAAEDGDFQAPLSLNSAIAMATASLHGGSTARAPEASECTVVTASFATHGGFSERDANFVLFNGRSHLRSFCLLRC